MVVETRRSAFVIEIKAQLYRNKPVYNFSSFSSNSQFCVQMCFVLDSDSTALLCCTSFVDVVKRSQRAMRSASVNTSSLKSKKIKNVRTK